MTHGRASLTALAAVALLVGSSPAANADRHAAQTSVKKSHKLAAKKSKQRGKPKRVRWRARSVAFQTGAGVLFGGSSPGGSGAPGSPLPGGSSPGGPPTAPAPPSYHSVSVAAREWSLTLSRQVLTPGLETIQLNNRGEDPHNLVVSPEGTHTPLASFPETAPDAGHTQELELAPGRYLLWCSLPDHEANGMKATLRVE